ncbi:MAG: ABC transporter substrate-binding protein [Burkholderiales bacterium]|nr:MAG: ABC transporter substrate-binding protein [Betaproteobacteria bacterium]TAG84028.1 MAG: ABC transporter substrate-binding protein [Burkholderiales bacterium]
MKTKALALAVSVLLTFATHAQLNILCSTDADWCESKTREFSIATGIKVNMVRKATGEVFAQLRAEANNPKTDLWYGGTHDPHLQAANEGLLEPYVSANMKDQAAWSSDLLAKSKNQVTGIYRITLGFGVNRELLAQKKLKMPACWSDLVKPEFKGEVELSNPTTSGTAYTILATMVQLMGEDKGFEYLRTLHKNVNRYTTSGTAQKQSVARGESMIGITFLDEFIPEQFAGAPIETVLPCEGTGYSVGAMSLVKGGRNPQNAKKFFDWALTADAQTIRDQTKVIAIPSNKSAFAPERVRALERAKLIDYDFVRFGASAERRRLIEKWDATVRTAPK